MVVLFALVHRVKKVDCLDSAPAAKVKIPAHQLVSVQVLFSWIMSLLKCGQLCQISE